MPLLLQCMSPLVALSWLNLPCALKPAIGYGKRTLGSPRQSAAPQGPQQGPRRIAWRRRTARTSGWPIASMRPRRRSGRRGSGTCCQPVAFMMAGIVTPSGRLSSLITAPPRGPQQGLLRVREPTHARGRRYRSNRMGGLRGAVARGLLRATLGRAPAGCPLGIVTWNLSPSQLARHVRSAIAARQCAAWSVQGHYCNLRATLSISSIWSNRRNAIALKYPR
jgi:hypothetical protein